MGGKGFMSLRLLTWERKNILGESVLATVEEGNFAYHLEFEQLEGRIFSLEQEKWPARENGECVPRGILRWWMYLVLSGSRGTFALKRMTPRR